MRSRSIRRNLGRAPRSGQSSPAASPAASRSSTSAGARSRKRRRDRARSARSPSSQASAGRRSSDAVGPLDQADPARGVVVGGPEVVERVGVVESVGVEVVDRELGPRIRGSGRTSGWRSPRRRRPSASAIARTSRVLPAPSGPTRPITTPGATTLGEGPAEPLGLRLGIDLDDQAVRPIVQRASPALPDRQVVEAPDRQRLDRAVLAAEPEPGPGLDRADPVQRDRRSAGSASRASAASAGTTRQSSKSSPSPRACSSGGRPSRRRASGRRRGSGSRRRRASRRARRSRRGCGRGRRRGRRRGRSWRAGSADVDAARSASSILGLGPEVPAEEAAAERAGDEDGVARPGPRSRDRAGRAASPSTVTQTTSGPSQAFVSPPARATPNRSASGAMPAISPSATAAADRLGRATATNAATGRAGHRGDVREVHRQALVAGRLGAALVEPEVAAVHEHVGRHHERPGMAREVEDRRVVADAEPDHRMRGRSSPDRNGSARTRRGAGRLIGLRASRRGRRGRRGRPARRPARAARRRSRSPRRAPSARGRC